MVLQTHLPMYSNCVQTWTLCTMCNLCSMQSREQIQDHLCTCLLVTMFWTIELKLHVEQCWVCRPYCVSPHPPPRHPSPSPPPPRCRCSCGAMWVCRVCCILPSIASRSVMGWPPFISAQYAPFCVSCFWSLNSTFRIFSYATCISHRSVFALNAHFLQLYFLYFHKYCLMHWVWHVCPFAPQRFHKLQTLTNTGELYTKLQFQLIICQQGWLPSSPPTTPGL